ncbi:MAG: recombination protein RecR [uncultured bacterium (gcode 4)]|uniref:Recombination protein RecR n=1 Tax=uncultured bacterium (gcode 4) TaxID=1234023 RepID=K2AVR8_9BACT|nr:MAG: recombination protein RecR [uncultured bacterium (gcode 4)]
MPETLKRLIDIISFLPWIWEKSATKLAFFLLKSNPNYLKNFWTSLDKIQSEIKECKICFGYTDKDSDECEICSSTMRDNSILCVVEDYLDMISIEKLHIFKWKYHILGGSISPINWVLASDLKFGELFEKIKNEKFWEIIIATNPNIEWEATTMYIKENINDKNIKITRLSKWLPNSGYIEYADEITLINAFKWRN